LKINLKLNFVVSVKFPEALPSFSSAFKCSRCKFSTCEWYLRSYLVNRSSKTTASYPGQKPSFSTCSGCCSRAAPNSGCQDSVLSLLTEFCFRKTTLWALYNF